MPKHPIRETPKRHPDPNIQEKGGYITPATTISSLPVVPSGPAPGATPAAPKANAEPKK